MKYVKPERIWLKDSSELNERWVQERIAEDPSILGLWARTVQGVKLTDGDLQVGGAYPEEEREQLLDICNEKRKDDRCVCLADRAGKDLSRFDRLVFIAASGATRRASWR